ncbi:MAG: hypothetical protein MI919_43320 [Holophagales bacterium]|nr:hypothetical protein [Holophagales bacterium]
MKDREIREREAGPEPRPDEEPQVFAMKRGDDLWRMDKRAFLKSMALGTAAGAIGCSTTDTGEAGDPDEPGPPVGPDDDGDGGGGNDSIPPFDVEGISYRLIDLRDYNGTLPESGQNLAVIAYVQSDFFFRYFDAEGNQAVNVHESKVSDQTSVSEMKNLARSVTAARNAGAAEQARLAELFGNVRSSATEAGGAVSDRRMQGTRARSESGRRRMQGTIPGGSTSGRRLPGAEGRAEAGTAPRNLGTLRINGESYRESRIIATYKDGHTKLSHARGVIVVRTDALPEIVRMQLPQPVDNPSPRPTTIPAGESVTSPSAPREPPPTRRRSTGHYWRPN